MATLFGLVTIWTVLSLLISVGITVYSDPAGVSPEQVSKVPYTVGGDNRKAHIRCLSTFRRLYTDLRERVEGVATAPSGRRANRWRQWMLHYERRLLTERIRCLILDGPPDASDAIMGDLYDVAETLQTLTLDYKAAHARTVKGLEEDLVAFERLMGGIEARLEIETRP